MHIIVAADSPLDQRIIENITRKAGYNQIRSCTSGQQVLEALEKDPADVLITDKHLPDIDAIELTAHIGAQQITGSTAVVILADEFTSQEAFAAIKAGAQSLLIKPVLPEQLREKIQRLK